MNNFDTTTRTSSPRIEQLRPNEIFVFGSNLSGAHGGGAALLAVINSSRMGPGHRPARAILRHPNHARGPEAIKPYVDEFIQFAERHPDLTFLVTEIGCGIAASPSQIAPLAPATHLPNIYLPARFWAVLR